MVIYEVNITVSPQIYDTFLSWLDSHIIEMLKFEGFQNYNIYFNKEDEYSITIHYNIKEMRYLDTYIENYASNMRSKGKDEFQEKVSMTRRILIKK
tara:strand:- start:624 stop:911 length:288 start_codon:yes stop_codon:yes gene_type:complete